MSPENKQRIVGVIVLVAFVALLIPFLFTGNSKKTTSPKEVTATNVAIPQQPQVPVPPVQTPTPPPAAIENSTPEVIPSLADDVSIKQSNPITGAVPTTPTIKPETPKALAKPAEKKLSPKKLPAKQSHAVTKKSLKTKKLAKTRTKKPLSNKTFWSVQVGSFSDKARMQKLIAQLQQHNFNVFTQKVITNRGNLTRVLVGHEANKEKAKQLIKQLATKMKLSGHLIANK